MDFLLVLALSILPTAIAVYALLSYVFSRMLLHLDRQPVPKTPKDYGLDFQAVKFPASDGVQIDGWLIPGAGDKLIVITHVGGLTKYGSTREFTSMSKLFSGEIEFLKSAQHLNRSGYGVLMFDFRNHGESDSSPNGGPLYRKPGW